MLEPLLSRLNSLHVVLASSSEQRVKLLRSTNLKFEIRSSNFEENLDPKEHTFSEFVEQTALGKVNDVFEQCENSGTIPDIIIGADTMVAHNGRMHGKPHTKEAAIKTIKELTQLGLPNYVYTGVVVKSKYQVRKFTEVTTVHMKYLTDEEVQGYIDTGEPMGKAGGYGIQGIASTFVERIEGDANNVIGLPLCHLSQVLKEVVNATDEVEGEKSRT